MSDIFEKRIKEFPKYVVTTDGHVLSESKYSKKTPVGHIDQHGYALVTLSNDTRKKVKRFIHKLVAEAFLENPNHYNHVLHKDGNKLNNAADNLMWCSRSEYLKHYHDLKDAGLLPVNPDYYIY